MLYRHQKVREFYMKEMIARVKINEIEKKIISKAVDKTLVKSLAKVFRKTKT
jgi:hypothetical protein